MTKEVLLHGDALERLKELPDNSVDSVVTDPPYGLSKEPDIVEVLSKWINGEPYDHKHGGFMGKKWDSFVPHPDLWKEVYRVLKPGGHALVFAGTRTQDLMTIALRLAGFEVRDVIEWLYFTGFPKSYNISKAFDRKAGAKREKVGEYEVTRDISGGSWAQLHGKPNRAKMVDITAPATDLAKQWEGWGTALKPAHEPIIMVRKPLEVDGRKATIIDNVKEHGTGGLNVDGCRIGDGADRVSGGKSGSTAIWNEEANNKRTERPTGGRYPANCITLEGNQFYSKYFNVTLNVTLQELSKKASKKDRNSDWQGNEIDLDYKPYQNEYRFKSGDGELRERPKTKKKNHHPTVKPVDLMSWLVRLITPPNGTVLDPFAGSGSTLVAAKREGFGFIGVELTGEYIPIIEARTGVKADENN